MCYGGVPIAGGDETTPLFDPQKHTDFYSASKSRAEQLVLAANGALCQVWPLRAFDFTCSNSQSREVRGRSARHLIGDMDHRARGPGGSEQGWVDRAN